MYKVIELEKYNDWGDLMSVRAPVIAEFIVEEVCKEFGQENVYGHWEFDTQRVENALRDNYTAFIDGGHKLGPTLDCVLEYLENVWIELPQDCEETHKVKNYDFDERF